MTYYYKLEKLNDKFEKIYKFIAYCNKILQNVFGLSILLKWSFYKLTLLQIDEIRLKLIVRKF